MNIVYITFTYWPNVDGVQMVSNYQAEGLAKLGNNVTVITTSGNNEDEHNNVRIVRVPAYKNGLWVKGNKAQVQKVVLDETAKADVMILACYFDYLSQWVLPIVHKINCKKYVMMHGIWEFGYTDIDKSSFVKFIRKTVQNIRWKVYFKKYENVASTFDGVFHLHENDSSVHYFKSIGQNNNIVLLNGVEDIIWNEYNKNDVEHEKTIFIQIANYSFRKNQEMAIKCFIDADIEDAELWLIGSSENKYYLHLKNVIESYGNKNNKIRMYVGLERREIASLIGKADIVILSSLSEHLPITILEGLAAGKPYISTDVGVIKYIPGGIVVNNNEEMIKAMNKLAYNKIYRKELSIKGHNYVEDNCHIDQIIEKQFFTISN